MNTSILIDQLKKQSRQGITPARTNMAGQLPDTRSGAPQTAAAAVSQQVQQLAQQLANQMVAEQQQAQITARNGRVYTKFDMVNDVISNQTEIVTAGLWSDNVAGLKTYFTSSTQTNTQRAYYVDVLQSNPSVSGSATQFSIAWGHALGSGSDSQGQLNDSPSKAIYSQYRQLLLNPTDTRFTTKGSGSTDYIYVVNFKRNRLKERMDPGNFELPLSKINTRTSNATGSVTTASGVFTLIDDSSKSNELGLRYSELIPLLVAAIKELTARVEALEA